MSPDFRKGNLQLQFEEFHRNNPDVFDEIVDICNELRWRRGFHRCGISLVFERLRWLRAIQTKGDEFKLNNNYRAFYARLVMFLYPGLNGFFEIRDQRIEYEVDLAALGMKEEEVRP